MESLIPRSQQRHLVRLARDWYLETYADKVTRQGTCVVATAGPPGAGKSMILPAAVPDVASRLAIDPDTAKDYLAAWCRDHGVYDDLLSTTLPDGSALAPLDLSPLLQTMSTEVANALRRDALASQATSVCRSNARILTELIRAGSTALEHVTLSEYDDDTLTRVDADPPCALDT